MKIVIGAMPDDSGDDGLVLGSLLCRALGAEPLLVHVHPTPFNYVSSAHVDAEWRAALHRQAEKVLAGASARMARLGWNNVETAIGAHNSSGQGLALVASDENADMIVIGSAPGGSLGRFQIGSTADKLLHGSPVPVAIAPSGYRRAAPVKLGRIVVGYQDDKESRRALAKGAEIAETAGIPLDVLTVLVRHRIYGSKVHSGEEAIIEELRQQTAQSQRDALAQVTLHHEPRVTISVADSPMAALQRIDWEGDEMLVLSSARGGQLRRVFLGDMTYKLLRATPVPALILPRHH